ncbi:hypothetical protein [Bdellovibrio bacteriovorus]|uniref:hypothetical protein n=1 Tax=Bdellovibrio bacteriovorus TaxID=959 RepID=UPI0035A6180D
MKILLASFLLMASSSAFALESHYGQVSRSGHVWHCSLSNQSDETLSMKYVEFGFSRLGSKGEDLEIRKQIDEQVYPGETLTSSVRESRAHGAYYCRFWAR